MKIIFASKFYYRRGGLEAYLFKTKELLENHGHEVIPFSTDFNMNYESEYSDLFCTYYNLSKDEFSRRPTMRNFKASGNMFFNREAYRNMRALIERTKPDLVQGFGVTKHLSYSIFKAAKDAGVPTVMRLSDFALLCPNSTATDSTGALCPEITCSERNITNIMKRKCIHHSVMASFMGVLEVNFHLFFRSYKKYVDYFIAPSKFLRDTFIKRFRISPDRIIYIPIFEGHEENSIGIADEGYFVFAGRLTDGKGVMTLLKALKKNPGYRIFIAGEGPDAEKYENYVQKNGLNVEFTGHISYKRLRELISKCRAVIVPSECFENSPNIVLEGYSYGKPVIGSRIGGIPELIMENKTGMLFESGSVEKLASSMKALHEDRSLADKMGRKGREFLESRFTPERHYRELEKFYKSSIKKKILHINNFYYNRGGDCTYLMSVQKLLEKKGHKTIVFSMNHPQNMDSSWSRYFVDYINYDDEVKAINLKSGIRVASRTIFFLQAKMMIKKLIREEKPDIAHLHNIHHHITPSILYELHKNNIPVVWTLHDYQLICPNISFLSHGKVCERCKKHKYYWPPIVRCKKDSFTASLMSSIEIILHSIMGIDRYVSQYIAPSKFLRDKFIEFGFNSKKMNHLPYVTNVKLNNETEETDNYYMYVGRISEEKGIKTLIDAAATIKQCKLKIVGGGPLYDEMIAYANAQDKNKVIEFLGHKKHDEVIQLIKRSKFVVVPSEWYENYPFAIIETFTCGKPAIASRIGGIPELIKDRERGLIFEAGNSDELRDCIQHLLDNPDLTDKMGVNAKRFIAQELNEENHYKKLMRIYDRADKRINNIN